MDVAGYILAGGSWCWRMVAGGGGYILDGGGWWYSLV